MKRFKAFTLVETLFAIVIFCIGILTVLLWLSQTLRNQDYANTQIKSAFFAREWIEMMFNLRDANYHKELPWNCIFKRTEINSSKIYAENENPFCDGLFENWKVLKLSIWSGDDYIYTEVWTLENDFDKDFENFQIYLHTWSNMWFVYDYVWTEGEKTWFARYLKIDSVDVWGWGNVDDNLLKVESHVLYKRWSLTWDKVMETFIGNYEFKQ
jgi:type II secretory pathway pseudopilin PulG